MYATSRRSTAMRLALAFCAARSTAPRNSSSASMSRWLAVPSSRAATAEPSSSAEPLSFSTSNEAMSRPPTSSLLRRFEAKHQQRDVVARGPRPVADEPEEVVADLLDGSLGDRRQRFTEAAEAELLATPVHRFGDTVGVEQHQVAGLEPKLAVDGE